MTNLYRFLFPILDTLLRSHKDLNLVMGIVLGIFLGFFPVGTLQWFLAVIAFLLFRVNLLSFLSVFTASYIGSRLFDTVWNSIGFRLLATRAELFPFWGRLQNAPILPFTEFNNTVVLGASLFALLFAPAAGLLFFIFRKGIKSLISRLWYQTKISRFYAHYRRY